MENRICKVCGVEKPISSFRVVRGIYHSHTCSKCKYLKNRVNIDRVRKYDAEWKRNWRKHHKDKVHDANQKRYYKNRDKYLAQKHEYYLKNKARIAAYNKSYLQSEFGKERNREGGSRYEARKHKATIEPVKRNVVYKRDRGICYLCGKKVSKKNWQLEHIIPLSRNGKHSYENVAVSHPKCNQMKRDKTPEEYERWLEKLKK